MKLKDVSTGFNEKNVDAIVLDLGDPCVVIPHAYDSLKFGGIITIFLPTYNQIEKVLIKLQEFDFDDLKAHELIRRDLQLKPHAIRPNTRMIGHTGFLIFARKVFKEVEE